MSEILKQFTALSAFYSLRLKWEEIEEIYEIEKEQQHENNEDFFNEERLKSSETDKTMPEITSFGEIPLIKEASNNSLIISNLQELSASIRSLRESNSGYNNDIDSWNRIIEITPRDKYLAFIYTLLKMGSYKHTSKIYRRISLITANAYILSLTIPGAKEYHIFEEKIILEALNVFQLIQSLHDSKEVSKSDRIELWMNFLTLCDDLIVLFRYVHFDGYKSVRNSIIWELFKVLHHNHKNGFENIYAAHLHSKIFDVLDEIINEHNGDPKETLKKILSYSLCFHVIPAYPRRREYFNTEGGMNICEHISDWFLRAISKYPDTMTEVLHFYIQFVITNPEKEWKSEHIQKALDYAAKYDAALFTQCNKSILDFLKKSGDSEDMQIRLNTTDLLLRLIQLEAKVDWVVFTNEISEIPREVYILKELMERLLDVSNTIKLRAIHGLHDTYSKGTQDAKKIFKECMTFAKFDNDTNTGNIELPIEPRVRSREIRFQEPKPIPPAYTFKGEELLEPYFRSLPKTLYYLSQNGSANVRKATITLIELMVLTNPQIIYKTNFVKECSRLGADPSLIVRKQALLMIDNVLTHYPNCYPVIYVWCKIIIPLFKDNDQKAVDAACESFKKKVFDYINGIDNTNKPESFMPWMILRVLLSTQPRHFLQNCINSSINKRLISDKLVSLIESHTLTSNSTEAWILLSFLAGKVKSKNPDSLISSFIKTMTNHSWNTGQNLQIILEVLAISIADFSHSALNNAFKCISNLLKSGSMPTILVSKAFNFCVEIKGKSSENAKKKKTTDNPFGVQHDIAHLEWVQEIHEISEVYLLQNISNFPGNRRKIMSYLFIYSDSNVELPVRPREEIITFIQGYLRKYLKIRDTDLNQDDIITLNEMIILAARFSVRDPNIAENTLGIYRPILRKTNRPSTINNVIVAISDLCQKYTHIVECSLVDVLNKLRSPYLEVRLVTFENLAQLVLQDILKLRGNLLLCFMITLLDENPKLSNKATEFFFTYKEEKNAAIFQNCLRECPFVYNNYFDFKDFSNFNMESKKMKSPISGTENLKSRRILYEVLIFETQEVMQFMAFDLLKTIKVKAKEGSLKSPQGIAAVKDIFYILEQICIKSLKKNETKSSHQNQENQEENPDDQDNLVDGFNDSAASTTPAENEKTQGRGRKKSNLPTMEVALSCVEKSISHLPEIAEIMQTWDESIKEYVDSLALAIGKRFNNMVEFMQPTTFWKKHLCTSKTSPKKRKGRRVDEDDDSESDEDNEVTNPESGRESVTTVGSRRSPRKTKNSMEKTN